MRDLMMELIEKFALRKRRSRVRLPGAQGAQPFGCTCKRAGQRPANENQRENGDEERLHQSVDDGIAQRVINLTVDVRGVMHQRQRANQLAIAVKRQGIDMDWRVVDALELGVADVALGSIGGSGRPELEERSKAAGYSNGQAHGVVNGNPFQAVTLPETLTQAFHTLFPQRPGKLSPH